MKSKSLAPIPATLAFSAFLVTPGFAAEAAPATAGETPATNAGVDTNSEAYKKAYEKAYAEAKAKQAAKATETPATEKDGKISDVTVTAKKEVAKPGYKAESANFKRPTPL